MRLTHSSRSSRSEKLRGLLLAIARAPSLALALAAILARLVAPTAVLGVPAALLPPALVLPPAIAVAAPATVARSRGARCSGLGSSPRPLLWPLSGTSAFPCPGWSPSPPPDPGLPSCLRGLLCPWVPSPSRSRPAPEQADFSRRQSSGASSSLPFRRTRTRLRWTASARIRLLWRRPRPRRRRHPWTQQPAKAPSEAWAPSASGPGANGRRASETASMPGGTPIMLRISLIWSLAETISCCCCSFSASSSDRGTEDRHAEAPACGQAR